MGIFLEIEKNFGEIGKEDKIKEFFDEICSVINSDDISIIAKENLENIDIFNYIYKELSFATIYKIMLDPLVTNILDNENATFVNLASGIGRSVFFNILYNKNKYSIGYENIFEMYEGAKELKKTLITMDTDELLNNKELYFFNNSLLAANITNADCILINYNNLSEEFQDMLENKILLEAKTDTLVIKINHTFKKKTRFKMLKAKLIKKNEEDKDTIFAYYYKVK